MLQIFEVFFFAALFVFIVTQMIYPAVVGNSLFPLFRGRERRKQMEVVKRLREDIAFQQAIDAILEDLQGTEFLTEPERVAMMARLKDNTDRVEAKVKEAIEEVECKDPSFCRASKLCDNCREREARNR